MPLLSLFLTANFDPCPSMGLQPQTTGRLSLLGPHLFQKCIACLCKARVCLVARSSDWDRQNFPFIDIGCDPILTQHGPLAQPSSPNPLLLQWHKVIVFSHCLIPLFSPCMKWQKITPLINNCTR